MHRAWCEMGDGPVRINGARRTIFAELPYVCAEEIKEKEHSPLLCR